MKIKKHIDLEIIGLVSFLIALIAGCVGAYLYTISGWEDLEGSLWRRKVEGGYLYRDGLSGKPEFVPTEGK
jgi:hypothetical protein